jgi:Immunity protein 8
VTPELKSVHCSEIDELATWDTERDDVCFWVELSIGLPMSEAADIYQAFVATPTGLTSTLGRKFKPRGSERPRPIVLQRYSWLALLDAIGERLERCAGADWREIQEKLRYHFVWEYENYQP